MSASIFLEQSALNHFFRGQARPTPGTVYLALYTSDPTEADIGTEVNCPSYRRQQITFAEPTRANNTTAIINDTEIRFPIAATNQGILTHIGIRTALTGGELLAHAVVPNPRNIETGDEAVFRIGSVTITLD